MNNPGLRCFAAPLAILMVLLTDSFCDNPKDGILKVSIRFTDNTIASFYMECVADQRGSEERESNLIVPTELGDRPMYVGPQYRFYMDYYAEAMESINKDTHRPFYYAKKNKINIVERSVFIGRKQIKEDENGDFSITPSDSAWRYSVQSTQFRWADAKQAEIFRNNRIVFDATHIVDEMTVFRVISFNPAVTKKQFRAWAKQGGFDEETLGFKSDSILAALNSGELLIIPLPQD